MTKHKCKNMRTSL